MLTKRRWCAVRRNANATRATMADDSIPPFDPKGCRYDQTTYTGRLRRFKELTNPLLLLVGDDELSKARSLLAAYNKGDRSASGADLWNAKRIEDAIIHPITGEKMFLPGRMSAFVPVNTPVTVGMLLPKTRPHRQSSGSGSTNRSTCCAIT